MRHTACASWTGFHETSNITTLVAAVTLIPTQPARVEISKIDGSGKSVNFLIIFSRSIDPQEPSIRIILLAQLSSPGSRGRVGSFLINSPSKSSVPRLHFGSELTLIFAGKKSIRKGFWPVSFEKSRLISLLWGLICAKCSTTAEL